MSHYVTLCNGRNGADSTSVSDPVSSSGSFREEQFNHIDHQAEYALKQVQGEGRPYHSNMT